jgi:hypothetical protein
MTRKVNKAGLLFPLGFLLLAIACFSFNPNVARAELILINSAVLPCETNPGKIRFQENYSFTIQAGDSVTKTVYLERYDGLDGVVTVDVLPKNGNSPSDVLVVTPSTVTFQDGESVKAVQFSVINSSVSQLGSLQLGNPTGGAAIGDKSTASVQIYGLNPGKIIIKPGTYFSYIEETDTVTRTVYLERIDGLDGRVTVDIAAWRAFPNYPQNNDVQITPSTVTFEDGESLKSFQFNVIDDDVLEGSPYYLISIYLQNLTGGATTVNNYNFLQLEIWDLEDFKNSVYLSNSTYTVNESAGSVQIDIDGYGISGQGSYAYFCTCNHTATAGQDYTAVQGTVSFTEGSSGPATVVIPIINDNFAEGPETFKVRLYGTRFVDEARSTAIITIVDDD